MEAPHLATKEKNGKTSDIIFFLRVEFQDGTHKEATQDYHGSCRPHLHVLLFTDDIEGMELNNVACATINPDGEAEVLKGFLLGSQCDRSHVTP